MNKMIARTALVATLAVSAMSLSACGTNNDCGSAEGTSAATDSAAMFSAKGGSHGHSSSHGTTGGSHGFTWPHWFGGSHSQQCQNPEPIPSANS